MTPNTHVRVFVCSFVCSQIWWYLTVFTLFPHHNTGVAWEEDYTHTHTHTQTHAHTNTHTHTRTHFWHDIKGVCAGDSFFVERDEERESE